LMEATIADTVATATSKKAIRVIGFLLPQCVMTTMLLSILPSFELGQALDQWSPKSPSIRARFISASLVWKPRFIAARIGKQSLLSLSSFVADSQAILPPR